MILINHFEAIRLEHIVSSVYSCHHGGIGGLASADLFEKQPFLAAILSLAPVYLNQDENKEIEQFFDYYKTVFDYPNENLTEEELENYISQLSELVQTYCK